MTGVSKSYVSGNSKRPVLQTISLTVSVGETVAVVGPSGSGKSTLLNLMGALDVADTGSICLNGQNLSELNEDQLAKIRNQEIGFIFQLHHLLPQFTVLENVLIPTLALRTESGGTISERAHRLLERVGLSEKANVFPGQLSGGEMQRVAVIRALINQPQIILADEPTGSLDNQTSDRLVNLLLELNSESDTALVVVTHSPTIAGRMNRIYRLEDGGLSSDPA